jgi:SAM-dependent methyltransferase
MYSDADSMALYDLVEGWGPSDDFYLEFVMAAGSVLDVGCGTGMLLHRARADGHTGRLTGIDPHRPSLDRARRRDDIEWVDGTAASATWDRAFELAVMANNGFQCFVTDEDLRASLTAIRAALVDGGRFVFETRNPAVRAWEDWNPVNADDLVDPAGRSIRTWYEVESVIDGVVTFTETIATPDGEPLRVDRASLRFLTPGELDGFLTEAGFTIEGRYGNWKRDPMTEKSHIITVARRVS